MSGHILNTVVDPVALNRCTTDNYVGVEVIRTVSKKSVFFWAVTLRSFGQNPTFQRDISPPTLGGSNKLRASGGKLDINFCWGLFSAFRPSGNHILACRAVTMRWQRETILGNGSGKLSVSLEFEKGEREKYGHRARGAWNQEWLCWWRPAANYLKPETEISLYKLNKYIRMNNAPFWVLTMVIMKSIFFWAKTPCRFGGSPTFRRNISSPPQGPKKEETKIKR
jgi:hypothetical protein